jgi:NAD(P)-dependent dehydrogenase (short-subunit alcohol dehydrogenase family)
MSKTILITGATDGIGKATAGLLASAGHEIIIHARTKEQGEKTVREIQQKTNNTAITFVAADFTELVHISTLVKTLTKQFKKIDVLINNAGVYREERNVLKNGLEENFMVNYLAHFYLTTELLPFLEKSQQARIINVSSMIHASEIDFENLQGEKWYDGSDAYSRSKLCNVLFTYKLAGNLNKNQITVNAVHPGVINTKLLIAGWGPMGEDTRFAAERFAFLAENRALKDTTGKYFSNNREISSSQISYNKEVQNKLWDISTELVKKLV